MIGAHAGMRQLLLAVTSNDIIEAKDSLVLHRWGKGKAETILRDRDV